MNEHILIPLPGLGASALPRDVFEQHLLKPGDAVVSPASELVDADGLEARTGIPASWWMTQARERRCHFEKWVATCDSMSPKSCLVMLTNAGTRELSAMKFRDLQGRAVASEALYGSC